jgi:hypothetical protein
MSKVRGTHPHSGVVRGAVGEWEKKITMRGVLSMSSKWQVVNKRIFRTNRADENKED